MFFIGKQLSQESFAGHFFYFRITGGCAELQQ